MDVSFFYYKRSPRILEDPAHETVELIRPPSVPEPPALNLISIMVPIMVTVAGSVAMMSFYSSTGNSRYATVQIISLCTMVASYFIPVLVHFQQKNKHRAKLKKRARQYDEHLDEKRTQMQAWKNEQVLNWHRSHMEPQFCIQMLKDRAASIWERIPQDDDFLAVRTGIGTVPSGFDIKAPKQEGLDKDPLVAKAIELADRFSTIANVPALMDLDRYRVVGIVGEEEEIQSFCRSVITQICTGHSPDEVKLAVFLNRMQHPMWDWVRWLPHIWDEGRKRRSIFTEGSDHAAMLEQLFTILQRRMWRTENKRERSLPFYVTFLPHAEMLEYEPILPLLLKQAHMVDTCTFVMAQSRDELPKECQLVVELKDGEGIMRSTSVTGLSQEDSKKKTNYVQRFQSDVMSLTQAQHFARSMAPYRVKSHAADEIINVLTLFQLFNIETTNELKITELWQEHRYPNTLPFPVGVRGGSKPVYLNLHDKIERKGHGPHGLMAGTTGSGKSEVIQSMIASLAVQYHPHDLALMLIDYKGGGMSNTFADLPHVIATITNLEEEGLIERSKVSLKAELKRRQKLFVAAGNVQHIDEYYKTAWRDKEPLPHLFIVIDEFAQLKKDQPEFMSELVSIAAIGRTLGVHLLLATQKPGGVVDDKIWSNSRYRVCLRVQDEADSREMLKIPDAAYITNPGRGYLQVGSNELFEAVQFAWSGAPYRPGQAQISDDINLYTIELDGSQVKLKDPLAPQLVKKSNDDGLEEKQLGVLIKHIAQQAQMRGIHRLPGPWLEPLPRELILDELGDGDFSPLSSMPTKILYPKVGLVDDVANQTQFPLYIDIESGHWIVFGMPGTGKTTFIQTMLYSLTHSTTPDDVHIYALDFGRMLRDYALLPHVGDVIQDDQEEKVGRLFHFLEEQLRYRKGLFADIGVKSRLSYCEETKSKLPAIVIIIDGYLSFKNQYELAHEKAEILMREGASMGIYFILTVNRVSDIMDKIKSNFPNAISYQLADSGDYHYAVGRLGAVPGQLPEGRGYVKGNLPPFEFHTALPIAAESESARARQLRIDFQSMDERWHGNKPKEIRILPDVVPLQEMWDLELAEQVDETSIPVGLTVDELAVFNWNYEDGPYFMIGGRMESGKTSLLMTIALMSAKNYSPDQLEIYMCDYRRSTPGLGLLSEVPHVKGYATDDTSLENMLQQLRNEVQRRTQERITGDEASTLLLLIDDTDVMAKRISGAYTLTEHLEYITRYGQECGVVIVAAGGANELNQNWDAWMKEIKAAQIGWLLGTTDLNEAQLFNIKIPYDQSGKVLPSGQGFYIKRKLTKVKVAHAFANGADQLSLQISDIENIQYTTKVSI